MATILDWIEKLEEHPNVQKSVQQIIEDRYVEIGAKLLRIDSAIERLMLFALEEMKHSYPHIAVVFEQRVKVDSRKKNYREPDILATVTLTGGGELKFVIECDSFKYHSFKTQEEMNEHYERTFELEMQALHVIRCTGSQINGNPLKYADIFYRIVDSHISAARLETFV